MIMISERYTTQTHLHFPLYTLLRLMEPMCIAILLLHFVVQTCSPASCSSLPSSWGRICGNKDPLPAPCTLALLSSITKHQERVDTPRSQPQGYCFMAKTPDKLLILSAVVVTLHSNQHSSKPQRHAACGKYTNTLKVHAYCTTPPLNEIATSSLSPAHLPKHFERKVSRRKGVMISSMTVKTTCNVSEDTGRIPTNLPPPYTWTGTRAGQLRYAREAYQQPGLPSTDTSPEPILLILRRPAHSLLVLSLRHSLFTLRF